MNAVGQIILDVFRQARASGLQAAALGVTALAAAACALARVEPSASGFTASLPGGVTLFSGESVPDVVTGAQFWLAAMIADTLGVLAALIWTAGFLPSFLDPRSVSVLLAKPPGRATQFIARWLGVVLFVAANGAIFVGVTWIIVGLRSGVWSGSYWLCLPLLIVHFAAFYAFAAVLAVMTRSAAACIVGSIVFWALCWAMNFGRHTLAGIEVPGASGGVQRLADFGYWLLPKPLDFSLLLTQSLGAERFAPTWAPLAAIRDAGQISPLAVLGSSLAAGAVLLAVAAYEFCHDDY
jgi:ABC-type transport system involved in multi-copper enzyme maturation permease subunit